ncbi:PapB/FocB family fimbrial expression transcriptional regulator [Escherichia coli]
MENKNNGTSLNKGAKNKMLIPGFVSEAAFDLLIELSSVHSIKIINALHDYLVSGDSRKIACERHGANSSYFSIALGRLFRINQIVSQLASYYSEQERWFREGE